MIGVRIGARFGASFGTAIGVGLDPLSPGGGSIPGVSRDAASGWYFPASATEWTTFRAAIGIASGNPSGLYLCQEPSGNAADSIGANTLTAAGTPLYQQPIPGFTRVGFGFSQVASQRFLSAGGPSPSATSVLWIGAVAITGAMASTRDIIVAASGANPLKLQGTNTPKPNVLDNATGTLGANNFTTTLQLMGLKRDLTNSVCTAYTFQEKITTVFDAGVVGASSGFGAGSGNGFLGLLGYGIYFQGAAAELSDATVKTLFQGMSGQVMPW